MLLLEFRLVHNVDEERPEEGGRLAAAGLRDADDVAAAQRRGNRHRLDGCRLRELALPDQRQGYFSFHILMQERVS